MGKLVGQHDGRFANFHFRMHDFAIGARKRIISVALKNLLVKVDGAGRVADDQIRVTVMTVILPVGLDIVDIVQPVFPPTQKRWLQVPT